MVIFRTVAWLELLPVCFLVAGLLTDFSRLVGWLAPANYEVD